MQASLGLQQAIARALLTAIVLALVVGPIALLVLTSFSKAGADPFSWSDLTFSNYVEILNQADTFVLVRNTLVYAVGSVSISLVLAFCFAWLCERTDMPFRASTRILMFSWMAVPPLVMSYGWILLINPGNGILNVFLRQTFGLSESPLSIYSMGAMIVLSGLSHAPTAFIMMSGLIRNMDPQLETAAQVHGAGRSAVLRRVTLPLLKPGLLSIVIYLFMLMIQAFDLPLVIGLTARVPVLSTRIFTLASPSHGMPNYGLASSFGMAMLLVALGLMWLYFWTIRLSERFAVVTGKGFRPKRITLGWGRFAGAALVALYLGIMALPLLSLFWTSLFPYYRTPTWAGLATASFASYRDILNQPLILRALMNTLLLMFGSATLAMVLASLVSWFCVRTKGAHGKVLDILSFMPIAVPHIVMATAFLVLYLRTPFYGTIWVMILAHVTIYLAFSVRIMNAALLQIHKELEQAAMVSGASWLTSLRYVIIPLVWPHFVNGWLWVVAHSARDLTVPLILMSTSNVVVATAIWLVWEYPNPSGAAALSIIMVLGLAILVVPMQILANRRIES